MSRVPSRQLPSVFTGQLWRQLTELIQTGSQAALRDSSQLRHLHGTSLAAVLCQSPESASAFFEADGLSAVLRPEMLQSYRMKLAPAGLHGLDTVHPAALVCVLQVLVAVLGVLPTHNLALQSSLQWLERHLQPLLDVTQWVTRLPVPTSSEPLARATGGMTPNKVVAALAARTGRGAGRQGADAMLIVCRSPQSSPDTVQDLSVDGLAFWLSGRASMSSSSSSSSTNSTGGSGGGSGGYSNMVSMEADRHTNGIALCHRCVALFVELWSLIQTTVARRRKYSAGKADAFQAQLQKLEPVIHAALPGLLTQAASASLPDADSITDASTNSALLEALRPSEQTRYRIISNILHVWRYDSITEHIKMLDTKNPQAPSSTQSAWSLWLQGSGTFQLPSVAESAQRSHSIIAQVKGRSGVLCGVFVHACCHLMSLKLADALPIRSEMVETLEPSVTVDGGGHGEQLQFDGMPSTFTQLLYIIEVSLHLLCLHLMLLTTVADLDGAYGLQASPAPVQTPPAPGPRLAIVGQYLRLLIEFAAASGGSVALVARHPKSSDLPRTISNLAFAASAASTAAWHQEGRCFLSGFRLHVVQVRARVLQLWLLCLDPTVVAALG